MISRNKCAEFGLYILCGWSFFTIICLISFLLNKTFNLNHLNFVNSFIFISVYLGAMASALTLLIGLASLSYKPKKLAVFILLSSLVIFIKNFGGVFFSAIS